jgi:hypothetical protein
MVGENEQIVVLQSRVEKLGEEVEALQSQMSIVLMMLSQPAPEPVQEPEPQIIHDYKDINFPI